MRRISALDDLTINKIAAGEVVERPASVVKELLENSLDAGANRITIEIEDGGKKLIKVLDNGSGIHPDDMEKAFDRHSTSKIRKIEDIDQLHSNGFRGEALSSISSVARIEIISNQDDSELGRQAQVYDGKVQKIWTVGAKKGTSITVSDIFYNLPARKKFLRSTATETSNISDIVARLAVIHHDVAIKYISNKREVFSTTGDGQMINAIASVYGRALTRNLLPVAFENNLLKIRGYISNTSLYQSNRKKENIYINKRYIKISPLTYQIENVYKGIIPLGKFPVFFLDLEIKPDMVDPNVHPSKLEVKISNDLDISNPLNDTIKEALFKSSSHLIPQARTRSFRPGHEEVFTPKSKNVFEYKEVDLSRVAEEDKEVLVESVQEGTGPSEVSFAAVPSAPILEQDSRIEKEDYQQGDFFEKEEALLDYRDLNFIGIAFNTYILVTYGDSIFMIDQHAAHERVMFEQIRENLDLDDPNKQLESQKLLMADIKEFSSMEHELIVNNQELFMKLGFEVDDFGFNRIAIRSYPILFSKLQEEDLFEEVLSYLIEEKNFSLNEAFMDKIASMACRKAIKANQIIGKEEAELLFAQLNQCKNKYTCPHGRPIFVELKKYEIEKMFKRVL